MTPEIIRTIEMSQGDVIHIERGSHAGWSVRRGFADRGISNDSAFFSNASDVLTYLGKSLGATN